MPAAKIFFLFGKCHVEEALSAVECAYLSHFIGGQFKVEDIKIVFHMLRIGGAREYDIACLYMPAQYYLHVALAVLFSQSAENCFTYQPLVAVTDGIPAFNGSAVLFNTLFQGVMLIVWVTLDLQNRRLDSGGFTQFF